MGEIRLPNITGTTEKEQLRQIRSYLYQLARQLQGANQIQGISAAEKPKASGSGKEITIPAPAAQFSAIKSLIIKSADIAEAYYTVIDELLSTSGKYLASSVFGTFQEEVNQRIGADHQSLLQTVERVETIVSDVAGVGNWLKSQQAYLRYGSVGTTLDDTHLADTNAPGIEIGDYQALSDGASTQVNRRFARFTAYGLELFDGSMENAPVAYIKQNKLYITNAEIVQSLKVGGFNLSKADGLSFDWVGV